MLSDRLKTLRKEKHLTQQKLANKLGVSCGTVAMWETNKREPDFEMLNQIAYFFNVSTDYLSCWRSSRVSAAQSVLLYYHTARKMSRDLR